MQPGGPVGTFDEQRATAAVRELLLAVGEDPDREGLLETPARVAGAFRELLAGARLDARDVLSTTFDIGHDEMVLVKDIEMRSLCEHHLLPFTGVAHVGYIPSDTGRITGLSKLARLVDVYARRLQVQERLTEQIAAAIQDVLRPQGVGVVIEAAHLCMMMRGVEKQNSKTVTSAMKGVFREDLRTRDECLRLVAGTTLG